MRTGIRLAVCAGLVAATLSMAPVRAQDVSARDRQSAAEAYDRGTAAYLAEDFEGAAQWFETAYRLAPAAAALVQATRAYQRAGNEQRAATLALRLNALYPDDRTARSTAQRALAAARQFLRVDVTCAGDCTLEVGGAILGHTSFFLAPDADHEVTAEFETGRVTQTARGAAGETVALSFEAPPAPEPEPEPEPAPVTPDPEPIVEPADGGGGVPLAVTITGVVITAGLGGVLIWSGVDALDGVPAYEANPTAEGLADGRSREERTNWLIAGTAVAGAATVILAIFTDWGGGGDGNAEDTAATATLDLGPDRAILGARGRF